MTIMPERFSRNTRLSRSIRLWMALNFGRATEKTAMIMPNMITTASAMIHHMLGLLPIARMVPPMPMMGA